MNSSPWKQEGGKWFLSVITGTSDTSHVVFKFDWSSFQVSDVPLIEWWDEVVLGGTYDMIPDENIDSDNKYVKTITNLVEHPIQLKPPDEPLQPQYLKASIYCSLWMKCFFSKFFSCFWLYLKIFFCFIQGLFDKSRAEKDPTTEQKGSTKRTDGENKVSSLRTLFF